MTIKKLGILLVALLPLAACATTLYKPARGPESFGYSEAPLEDGRYRVSFRGRNFNTAYDFALLRAAEITLAKNHTWFRVTNSFSNEDSDNGYGSHVTFGSGYGGYYGHRSSWGFGTSIPLATPYKSALHSIDIQLGDGPTPEEENVYDAASVKATIGPRVSSS